MQLLDIRDTVTHTKENMSEHTEINDEIENDRTKLTIELVDEKDIPEVLTLLKEFFFKVRIIITNGFFITD